MSTYADPGFHVHAAMGQWLTLMAYHIADDAVIPWDLPNAAHVLREYHDELTDTIADSGYDVDVSELEEALNIFEARADAITSTARLADAAGDQTLLAVINAKYRDFARGYVSQGGLPGRPTFRNVLSAPGIDNGKSFHLRAVRLLACGGIRWLTEVTTIGYGASVFPPVTESVEAGDLELAAEWVSKSAKAILRAAEILKI